MQGISIQITEKRIERVLVVSCVALKFIALWRFVAAGYRIKLKTATEPVKRAHKFALANSNNVYGRHGNGRRKSMNDRGRATRRKDWRIVTG